jgi:hypothetical protein
MSELQPDKAGLWHAKMRSVKTALMTKSGVPKDFSDR